MSAATPLLRLRDITMDYAVRVLHQVSVDVKAGTIHALLGANGAGKSTLCRIISGLTQPTGGSMMFDGVEYAPRTKSEAEAAGIQIVQQELNLIPTLTVAENVMFGRTPHRLGFVNRHEQRQQARRALDRFGLKDIPVDQPVGELGIGQQQMIEIASALDRECRLLILDEPTAALSGGETERLFHWLEQLREQGTAIIYISHRLEEVVRLADEITVLCDGRHVTTKSAKDVTTDQMVDLMTNSTEATSPVREFQSHRTDRVVMKVNGMTREPVVRDVSFTVHAGERFGIAGLVGSGRTELLRLLFGADVAEQGNLQLNGEPRKFRFRHPWQAVKHGLAMVTEDRKETGLLLAQSIRMNSTLVSLKQRFQRLGWINRSGERTESEELRRRLDTRCNHIEQPVGTLSGGNQQKVAVGKWLVEEADVYLFDEPTRGIDVAARRRIHALIEELAAAGKAIVIVSSDLEELYETCDTIGVMSAGRMVGVNRRDDWSTEIIMRQSFAGYGSSTEGAA